MNDLDPQFRLLVLGSSAWTNAPMVSDALDYMRQLPAALGRELAIYTKGSSRVTRYVKSYTKERAVTHFPSTQLSTPQLCTKIAMHACVAFVMPCNRRKCWSEPPHFSHGCNESIDVAQMLDIPVMIADCYGDWYETALHSEGNPAQLRDTTHNDLE